MKIKIEKSLLTWLLKIIADSGIELSEREAEKVDEAFDLLEKDGE